MKRILSVLAFLLVSATDIAYTAPTLPLATLEAEKKSASIVIKVVPKETYKWAKEFKASLDIVLSYDLSGVNCWGEQCVENHTYKISQNEITNTSGYKHYKTTFEIVEGIPVVTFSLLGPSQSVYLEKALVKIKFAVCNETSCYPQKAEKLVRF